MGVCGRALAVQPGRMKECLSVRQAHGFLVWHMVSWTTLGGMYSPLAGRYGPSGWLGFHCTGIRSHGGFGRQISSKWRIQRGYSALGGPSRYMVPMDGPWRAYSLPGGPQIGI